MEKNKANRGEIWSARKGQSSNWVRQKNIRRQATRCVVASGDKRRPTERDLQECRAATIARAAARSAVPTQYLEPCRLTVAARVGCGDITLVRADDDLPGAEVHIRVGDRREDMT